MFYHTVSSFFEAEGDFAENLEELEVCERFALKGTGSGMCGRPLDQHGNCDRASAHRN